MIPKSIRWRLQIWHGLILVIVLTAFGFTAYEVARENRLREIDEELYQQYGWVLPPPPSRSDQSPPSGLSPRDPRGARPHGNRPPGQDIGHNLAKEAILQINRPGSGPTNEFYFLMWQKDGSLLASSGGAPANVPRPERVTAFGGTAETRESGGMHGPPFPGPGPSRGRSAARSRGEFREVFQFMPSGDCILIGRSIASDLASMRQLRWWFIAAGAGILALGLAGGWWLASRAIQPIESISATAVKIAAGDLAQRISVADTESELGRLASVLNSTFVRLQVAFANQARFTSDASHELRTPVSVILTQTQSALSRERSAAEYREALQACQRSAQRMRRLAESLLELARLDSGQETMKRERFDLTGVVRESVELVRPLAEQRGIEIRSDLAPAECLGDSARIAQVITNLLANAIHFNCDQGMVDVKTGAENGQATLVVADTGIGIPAEDLPHVFERFYRVDKSRSRLQGHAGLGLAISKAILDANHGTIEISSQPGKGSTVTVKLPVH